MKEKEDEDTEVGGIKQCRSPRPCKRILEFIPRHNAKSSTFSEQLSGMIIRGFTKELRDPIYRRVRGEEMTALCSSSGER